MRCYTTMAWVFTVSLLPAMAALASPLVTVLETFDASQGQLPESITADDAGNLYFSVGGTLREFTVRNRYKGVSWAKKAGMEPKRWPNLDGNGEPRRRTLAPGP